jgi:hypothetical protein
MLEANVRVVKMLRVIYTGPFEGTLFLQLVQEDVDVR